MVEKLVKEQKIKDARRDKIRLNKLRELGFEGENAGEALI